MILLDMNAKPIQMSNYTKPFILTDLSRLKELYKFRVFAWENSPGHASINSSLCPDGYYDHREEKSIHIIATAEDRIVGSARLTICHSLEEIPAIFKTYENLIPPTRPFLFYSRMAVHPDYRKTSLRKELDDFRVKTHADLQIPFGLINTNQKRLRQLADYDVKTLGTIQQQLIPNSSIEKRMITLIRPNTKIP